MQYSEQELEKLIREVVTNTLKTINSGFET